MRTFAASVALAAVLLVGCTTRHTFTAEVEVPGPVGRECLTVALDDAPDVEDVVPTGDDAVEFRLSSRGEASKRWPSFSLVERAGMTGPRVLSLSTTYDTGLFEPDPQPRIERAQELMGAVAESCTGRAPTFGEAHPCGAGESDDLCVTGH